MGRLVPLMVDGLIYATSMAMPTRRRRRRFYQHGVTSRGIARNVYALERVAGRKPQLFRDL